MDGNLPQHPKQSHAVVIGASLAGLVTARVLADSFGQVTVIDRDRLPAGPEHRKGVPQDAHVHGLLVRGYRLLNELFPGLEAELIAAGAPRIDWLADFPSLLAGGWSPRYGSELITHTSSRALLEHLIRRRVAAYLNVRIMDECEVTGLIHKETTVTGVRIRSRGGKDRDVTCEIPGDFVADTSGRNSRTSEWLQTLGYERADVTTVNAFLGYATRWYWQPDNVDVNWKALVIAQKAPHDRRGGVIFPVEGNRWIVTLGGMARDYPPTDEGGFLDFARSLRSPLIYEAMKEAEPLTPIYGYQRTDNCLRHYERLTRWPDHFVVLGDAACALNPVYGQGMTVALLGAVALGRSLEGCNKTGGPRDLSGVAQRFQREMAEIVKVPWLLATGQDLLWSTAKSERALTSPTTWLIHRYLDQIFIAIPRSAAVHRTFAGVVHLLQPPSRLFYPDMVLRVIGHVLGLTAARWIALLAATRNDDTGPTDNHPGG